MPFDQNEMHYRFRELAGQPPESMVSFRTVNMHLQSGVNIIAEMIGLPKRTDNTQFGLEAGVYVYPLPSNFLQIQEAMWNNKFLRFTSIEEWRRASVNWRGATSANPDEIAVDGREIILYPPPSADAITADPNLTLRYKQATFELTPEGVPGFGDNDVNLAIYAGVQEYLSFKNMDGRYNLLIQQVEKLLALRLPAAKARYALMIEDYQPTTEAPPRMPAAR